MLRKSNKNKSWSTAFLTGLISATFSTLLISIGARRIGRDAKVDWMEVGTVILRDSGVKAKPGLREVIAGIVVHTTADIFWATSLFGLFVSRLKQYRKRMVLILMLPWAVVTSAIEYFLLLPWLQPLLKHQVPYWTALMVHIGSGLAYPVYFWLRSGSRDYSQDDKRFGQLTTLVLGILLGFLSGLTALAKMGRVVPWPFGKKSAQEADQKFLRHMTWHHEVGVWLSKVAVDKAIRDELRVLGRLMLAQHRAELKVMRDWWQSWYDEKMEPLSPEEYDSMPGMPPVEEMHKLETLDGAEFEQKFLLLMMDHHLGAIAMATEVCDTGTDVRVKLFADSIRHTQRNQVQQMKKLTVSGRLAEKEEPPRFTVKTT